MTDFSDMTAAEIADTVAAYGFYWAQYDETVQDVTADNVIEFEDGSTKRITGTLCRSAWADWKKANPHTTLALNKQYDVDGEIANVIAQQIVFGELVYD